MVLALSFVLLFLSGCASLERDNIYDPYGDNYVGTGGGGSNSSGGGSSSNSSTISYGKLTYQGQDYKTVQIGDQTWMAENLNYNVSGSDCYNGDLSNCTTYGRLYNWETANAVCPSDWRLPSTEDWKTLTDRVGSNAGTKLKAKSGWSGDGNGTDDYGFSALPRGPGETYAIWWTSSESNGCNYGYYRSIHSSSSDVVFKRYVSGVPCIDYSPNKSSLHSVRCVKDLENAK